MKYKNIIATLLLLAIVATTAKADEGMWLLNLIGKNYKQMKAQGFRLKPEDVYSVNKSSIKDAVVVFGGYCTGEIVSDQGLIFTNHHCGYQSIQQHSTVAHDYLKDGFWANSFEEEIPTPDLYVSILQEIADVTDDVLKGVANHDEEQIEANIKKITEEYKKKYSSEFHRIEIKPFFEGNAYYLSVFLDYKDVRMVGTPPDAIGKFGGDTDNWMWPRHTCDFSVFRVYVGKDGNPAKYDASNVPLKPKHHLPISLKGYKKGDFAMVIGFPGTTQRYSTSYEINNDMLTNDARAKIRGIRQDVLHADMEASDEIRIKYATKYSHSSNYWKNSIEANKSLKALNIVGEKEQQEREFANWYKANASRQNEYQDALGQIKNACNADRDNAIILTYVNECFFTGMELLMHGYHIINYVLDPEGQTREEFIKDAHDFYKDYSRETDYKSSLAMAKLYMEDIDKDYHPSFLKTMSADSAIAFMFTSKFSTKEGFDEFIANPTREALLTDPVISNFLSVLDVYRDLMAVNRTNETVLTNARRVYTKGVNEMNSGANPYPDANFTERLTYGTVQDYEVSNYQGKKNVDGVGPDANGSTLLKFYTTTDGVLEKEIPGDYEFDVPAKLKALLQNKDFGRYADKDGSLHTCFITNNDITGGNSGSPVIDGKGNLIGLAFDGNSEAMCSDWFFNTKLQRCINVDIRYVLFIIDKYGNSQRLINELTFAK
ncbi:MAG: S46 family peptidase [Bacteroidales bacterium]|nr:S46 family peptidase [Bacteroidales bacterium]